jgi:LmbE family N-acetylglucosaminyl deacetylase
LVHWVYLAPHFDDVILSCGGMIYEQVWRGQAVEVWTICAGEVPPGPLSPFAEELHLRWGTSVETVRLRSAEDREACKRVGAIHRHLDLPDCIYRRTPQGDFIVHGEADLFQPLPESEKATAARLGRRIRQILPPYARVVSPLGIGGHVDHRLTRAAAETLGRQVWYYADYPYVVQQPAFDPAEWLPGEAKAYHICVSKMGLDAWQMGIAAYESQISTFWNDETAMRKAIARYKRAKGGSRLWRPVL